MAEAKIFPNIHRQFADSFRKNIFHEISLKSFSKGYLLIFKFSENCPKAHREFPEKLSLTSFIKSIFPSFITFRSFPRILWSTCFQFCFAAESIGHYACPIVKPLSEDIWVKSITRFLPLLGHELATLCFWRMNAGKGSPRKPAGKLNCYEFLPGSGLSNEFFSTVQEF